ncbi:MAG: hypothetical protein H0X29_07770 [Parachlamydiaceae bacterium]|nr:hypothetical protein [Parachlamydiaceae bacterium]
MTTKAKSKAKESPQIEKARNKIKQQLEEAEKRINPQALAEMALLIQQQISRHKPDRVSLKTKQVTHQPLFDENKHPAKTESRFVNRLLKDLQHPKKSKPKNNLEGRIKSINN